MDYRTPTAIEFRSKLGSKQNDLTMTKEPSVLKRIMKIFASEKLLLQHFLLSYRTDLYFLKHKLEIEVDEKGHKNRDENKGLKKKATEKELVCKLVRINPDEKDFDMDIDFGKILRRINTSIKKSLMDKISKRLIEI